MGVRLARAEIPPDIASAIRLGRLTALQKPTGGVRGIFAGEMLARTVAQQISTVVERATAPFQYAMSTRACTECMAHALQALSELDPRATIVSIDGVSAFDLISRRAMMEALMEQEVVLRSCLFVRMFYGDHSTYLWEDDVGTVHHIEQGEGGEQGDVLMPLLFSLGQHAALQEVQDQPLEGERLFAFLDDIYVVTTPERVGHVYTLLHVHLQRHSSIQINGGKTRVWNAAGERPPACDLLERLSPDERVWPPSERARHQSAWHPTWPPSIRPGTVGGDHQETSDFA